MTNQVNWHSTEWDEYYKNKRNLPITMEDEEVEEPESGLTWTTIVFCALEAVACVAAIALLLGYRLYR